MFIRPRYTRRSPGAGTPPPSGLEHGFNIPYVTYDGGNHVFVDVLKAANYFWIDDATGTVPSMTADNWPIIPAGHTVRCFVVLPGTPAYDDQLGFYPTGNYKMVWSNTALTVSIETGPGLSSISAGSGTTTFTLSDLSGSWSTLKLHIFATNPTGAPSTLADLYMCLASEESLLSGKPYAFKPTFLSQISGAGCLRIHDLVWTDQHWPAWAKHFSDLGTQSLTMFSYSGAGGTARGQNICPVAVGAHLCKQVGSAMWVNPTVGTGQTYVYIKGSTSQFAIVDAGFENANQFTTNYQYPNGTPMMFFTFGGNSTFDAAIAPITHGQVVYVVNSGATFFQVSATLGGAPITLTSNTDKFPPVNNYGYMCPMNIDLYNDLFLPWAQALHAAEPTLHVFVEFDNEVWDNGFPGVEACAWPLATLAGFPGQIRYGYAYGALRAWKAFIDTFGASQVTCVVSGQMGFFAILDCFDYVEADTTINPSGLTFAQICSNYLSAHPTLPGAAYTVAAYGTPGFGSIRADLTAGSPIMKNVQFFPHPLVGNTVDDETSGSGYIAGSIVSIDSPTQITLNANATQTVTGAWLTCRVCTPAGAYQYNGNNPNVPDAFWSSEIQAAAASINFFVNSSLTQVRAKVPNLPLAIYEWGVYISGAGSFDANAIATFKSFVNYINGAGGGTDFKYFWDHAIAPNSPVVANHYRAPGGYYVASNLLFSYPISPAKPPDNARLTWYKTV